jgi:hypothetical protein
MGDDLADEGVGIRHSGAMLAPTTALRWLYEAATPVESSMTLERAATMRGTTGPGS